MGSFRKTKRVGRRGIFDFTGPIDLESEKIINVSDGENAQDAVNVSQLDFELPDCITKDGLVPMEGPLDMDGHKITGVVDPEEDQEVATKKYVDDVGGLMVKKDGSAAMEAALDMDGHKIVNLGDPGEELEDAQDVATKAYVDASQGILLKKDGLVPMEGPLDMDGHKIVNLGDPGEDAPQDVATKNYVDEEIEPLSLSDDRLTTIRHGKATLTAGIAAVTFSGLGYSDMNDTNYSVLMVLSGTAQGAIPGKNLSATNLLTTGFSIECEDEEATDDVYFLVLGLKEAGE